MKPASEWYHINNIEDYDTPALVVYHSRMLNNISLLKKYVKEPANLRPHVKTHKMLEVAKLLISEGIYKFKCATIAEAEMLGMAGAMDVLLAYQPVGPKVHRLIQLVKAFPNTKYSCLIDNIETGRGIANTFFQAHLNLEVYIDLDIGMHRTGILPENAFKLVQAVANMNGITLAGLHAYDGHLRDQDINDRREKCNQAFEPVKELADEIYKTTKLKPQIVAGGSPTFPVHAERGDVECSPGTFIFWDWGYHTGLPEQDFQIAALVISRIISIPGPQNICLDLGHKSVASEMPLSGRVKFLNLPAAELISQSEEHLNIKVDNAEAYKVGDVFYGAPSHICPTCALHEIAFVVENNNINNQWKVISRNRKISI